MKNPLVALLLMLSLWLSAGNASAQTERADLERWCRIETSAAGAGRCLGYLLAARDVLARDSIEGVRACLPPTVKLQEQLDIVMRWLQANPDARAATAMGLIARALATDYPCHDNR